MHRRPGYGIREALLEDEDNETNFVCFTCLEDEQLRLRQRPSKLYVPRECIGCKETVSHAISTKKLAQLTGPALIRHFEIDQEHFPGYGQSLRSLVQSALRCDRDAVIEMVVQLLEVSQNDASELGGEEFFAEGQAYQRKGAPFENEAHERWYVMDEWRHAANQLLHGRRFFNEDVRKLFDGILREALNAGSVDGESLRPVVKVIPVDFRFYRARVASDSVEAKKFVKEPADHLGAPPRERATNGRMSPAGIPFLYVAGDDRTCVAEVRPSIGDMVVVGRFKAVRELRIFDLTALSGRLDHQPLSLFDPQVDTRNQYRTLLRYLHGEISRPAKVTDTDYLMTQAFTEYIRFHCEEKFDGVAFWSVQRKRGINYALFDTMYEEKFERDPFQLGIFSGAARENEEDLDDRKPRFDVKITSADVAILEIIAVEYSTSPKNNPISSQFFDD